MYVAKLCFNKVIMQLLGNLGRIDITEQSGAICFELCTGIKHDASRASAVEITMRIMTQAATVVSQSPLQLNADLRNY